MDLETYWISGQNLDLAGIRNGAGWIIYLVKWMSSFLRGNDWFLPLEVVGVFQGLFLDLCKQSLNNEG